MTRFMPLWEQAGSYAASVDRRLISALWPLPASVGAAATASGSSLVVSVAAGQVAVPTQNNTGATLCCWDAAEQVTHAGGVSQPRIDVITCHPRANDIDGGSLNDFIIDIVQGTAAASPAVPVVPAGQVGLWQVLVPTGAVNLQQSNLTDVRPWGLAIAGTQSLPPPVTSGSAIQSFTDDNSEVWVAKNGVNGGVWRKARDVVHARWWRNAAWTGVTPIAALIMDRLDAGYDNYGLYSSGPGVYTAPVTGWYSIAFQTGLVATVANQLMQVSIQQTAGSVVGTLATINNYSSGVGNPLANVFTNRILTAGDQVQAQVRGQSQTGLVGPNSCYFWIDYLGSS